MFNARWFWRMACLLNFVFSFEQERSVNVITEGPLSIVSQSLDIFVTSFNHREERILEANWLYQWNTVLYHQCQIWSMYVGLLIFLTLLPCTYAYLSMYLSVYLEGCQGHKWVPQDQFSAFRSFFLILGQLNQFLNCKVMVCICCLGVVGDTKYLVELGQWKY